MGLFDQIIATGCGHNPDVLHGVEHGKFPKRCTITPELVRMDNLGNLVFTEQASEERAGGLGIPVLLKEDVQHSSTFIDGSPQPVFDPADVHVHFVEMPARTPSGFSLAQSLGKEVAELDAPRQDRFTGDANSSFQQQFFDIPIAEREAVVQPHGIADHGERKTIAGELLTAGHRVTLPEQLATTTRRKGVLPVPLHSPPGTIPQSEETAVRPGAKRPPD
ncbi:hypothetical protein DAETH_37560 (plasmid) [Deinococcus aetherius]|uniref:Uncharacterized protein n=1 Tax=Deinococcus aetherius TaxID=200252 RepID=A0ABM8AJA3_9DEIO|nr:hypothetical protein DAETH_37560 [Deinococcus aetherius]